MLHYKSSKNNSNVKNAGSLFVREALETCTKVSKGSSIYKVGGNIFSGIQLCGRIIEVKRPKRTVVFRIDDGSAKMKCMIFLEKTGLVEQSVKETVKDSRPEVEETVKDSTPDEEETVADSKTEVAETVIDCKTKEEKPPKSLPAMNDREKLIQSLKQLATESKDFWTPANSPNFNLVKNMYVRVTGRFGYDRKHLDNLIPNIMFVNILHEITQAEFVNHMTFMASRSFVEPNACKCKECDVNPPSKKSVKKY